MGSPTLQIFLARISITPCKGTPPNLGSFAMHQLKTGRHGEGGGARGSSFPKIPAVAGDWMGFFVVFFLRQGGVSSSDGVDPVELGLPIQGI